MFVNRREVAVYPVDPDRLDLVEEFRRAPFGPYSEELAKVLHRMRWESPGGRWVAITLEPGRRWMLGRLPGRRGLPMESFPDKVYTDLRDLEWEVFRMRWELITGASLQSRGMK